MRKPEHTHNFRNTARLAAVAVVLAIVSSATPAPPKTIATIDGKVVLETDLQVEGELRRLEQEAYQARRQALDNLIAKQVIEAEAARLGETPEQFFEREVIQKAGRPDDAEAEAFYEQRKDQIGAPLEQVKDKIVDYLRDMRIKTLRAELVDQLAAKRDITIFLDPPRLPVDIAGAPSEGPADAVVTIVEFSDFQCPFCKRVQPVLSNLHSRFGDQIRWVVKDLPLSQIHPQAQHAAEAARCAGDQGKLFEYRQKLFRAEALDDSSYGPMAAELGLDVSRFDDCLAGGVHVDAVLQDVAEASSLGIGGTPTFLINGAIYNGERDESGFAQAIRKEIERANKPRPADD